MITKSYEDDDILISIMEKEPAYKVLGVIFGLLANNYRICHIRQGDENVQLVFTKKNDSTYNRGQLFNFKIKNLEVYGTCSFKSDEVEIPKLFIKIEELPLLTNPGKYKLIIKYSGKTINETDHLNFFNQLITKVKVIEENLTKIEKLLQFLINTFVKTEFEIIRLNFVTNLNQLYKMITICDLEKVLNHLNCPDDNIYDEVIKILESLIKFKPEKYRFQPFEIVVNHYHNMYVMYITLMRKSFIQFVIEREYRRRRVYEQYFIKEYKLDDLKQIQKEKSNSIINLLVNILSENKSLNKFKVSTMKKVINIF